VREYNIQKELVHPRIVRLLDLFEIDAMSFATVLEVAPGGDLASHLQLHPVRAVNLRVHRAPVVGCRPPVSGFRPPASRLQPP
jgi:serine/threonine protein kinase